MGLQVPLIIDCSALVSLIIVPSRLSWLIGWPYRKKITITGSPGAGNGHQVLLKVGESSGASGCDFHLEGHSANFPSDTNDGGDLRFTESNGATLLSFWVEKVEGDANRVAYVWVKIAGNLDSDQDIWVYYGNASASNHSNGNDTFDFFDDFESYSENSDIDGQGGWQAKRIGGSGYAKVVVKNGTKHLKLTSTDGATTVVHPANLSNSGVAVETRTIAEDWNESMQIAFGDGDIISRGNLQNGYDFVWWGWGGGSSRIRRWKGGDPLDLATASDGAANEVYYRMKCVWKGNNLRGYRDGHLKLSATDSEFSSRSYLHLECWGGSTWLHDWVFIRKYTDPEPSFSSAGNEEVAERATSFRYIP